MRNLLIPSLASSAAALLMAFPWQAQAEIAGQARCASPSWNALLAGECTPDGAVVVDAPHAAPRSDAVQLVDLPAGIPEPETYLLMLAGLGALALAVQRRRRA